MTVSINASADGTYGELQVNGVPKLRFGADTSGQLNDFRNRIINGAFQFDQRNAGAAVTPVGGTTYTVDRWAFGATQASKIQLQQNLGAVTLASDVVNYLGAKTVSAFAVGAGDLFDLIHRIEGFNFADAKFGTADAQPVTLSFRLHSNVTGTHSGALRNGANNRSYPFTFSNPVADTWTTVAITIPGDTTGTWVGSTNGVGAELTFSLGAGATFSAPAGAWTAGNFVAATGAVSVVSTLNATFNIAKVQLEVGSIASAFERRLYGVEFGLCRRYRRPLPAIDYRGYQAAASSIILPFDIEPMRAPPTVIQPTVSVATNVTSVSIATSQSNHYALIGSVTALGSFQIATSSNGALDSEL